MTTSARRSILRADVSIRSAAAFVTALCGHTAAAAVDVSTWSNLNGALRASATLSCSYSQATIENGVTTVEKYDPRGGTHWALVSVDGRAPGKSDFDDYPKYLERRLPARESPIWLDVSKIVAADSITAVKGEDGFVDYRFQLTPQTPDLVEMTKVVEGSLHAPIDDPSEIKFVLINTRPIAYSLTFKVTNYHREVLLNWQPNFGAYFRTHESTLVEGKLMGLKSVSALTEIRYFDFGCEAASP